MKFFRSKIAWQLLLWLLVIEFPVESLLVYVSYQNSEQSLRTELTDKLRAIATYQIAEINEFVEEQLNKATNLAQIPELIGITNTLLHKQAKNEGNVTKTTKNEVKNILEEEQKILKKYIDIFSFKSLLLVSPEGTVLLSTNTTIKEGENLGEGTWKGTELSNNFLRANIILQADFSDFLYLPNQSALSTFVAVPIKNESGRPIAIMMLEADLQRITNAVRNYTGMGNSGEILLLTEIGKEIVFITPTRYQRADEPLKKFIAEDIKHKGEDVEKAIQAQTGYGIVTDYEGKKVFAHWHYVPALRSGIIIKENIDEAFAPITKLQKILLTIVFCTLLLFVFAAFNIATMFTKPIRKLNAITKKIANGDLSQRAAMQTNNEIGELAQSFDEMTEKIQQYQAELKDANVDLERKVQERTEELHTLVEELSQTNEELTTTVDFVETQKRELIKKNTNIEASITYAKRIQSSILPSVNYMQSYLPKFFVFFKPRDIVSGDFYWFTPLSENRFMLISVDCTGHGVPGAFMSMIGDSLLNQIILEKGIISPEDILHELDKGVKHSLQKGEYETRDGMDLSICLIDKDRKIIEFAGAMNPISVIQNRVLREIKADKRAIGSTHSENYLFTKHCIDIAIPTTVYMYSDGFQDQFGGENNRKFMVRKFKELLFEIHTQSMAEQHNILENTFLKWKGVHNSQVDDILVIGFYIVA
jgi:serine phosphatase RsbU (regulator of sigma subunit)